MEIYDSDQDVSGEEDKQFNFDNREDYMNDIERAIDIHEELRYFIDSNNLKMLDKPGAVSDLVNLIKKSD
jgi:hypothetical protein